MKTSTVESQTTSVANQDDQPVLNKDANLNTTINKETPSAETSPLDTHPTTQVK
jgi:hypothetical protein